jgi:hypothetical protein
LRTSRCSAKELGEKLARRDSFGQGVTMTAMCAEDDILPSEMSTDSNRNRFLSHVRMASAVDQALLM